MLRTIGLGLAGLALAACQGNEAGDKPALAKSLYAAVKTTDAAGFCAKIHSESDIFYRNSDTLRVVVRNTPGCSFELAPSVQADSLSLLYKSVTTACPDTLEYHYLEYGFRLPADAVYHVQVKEENGSAADIDTLVNTASITKGFACE